MVLMPSFLIWITKHFHPPRWRFKLKLIDKWFSSSFWSKSYQKGISHYLKYLILQTKNGRWLNKNHSLLKKLIFVINNPIFTFLLSHYKHFSYLFFITNYSNNNLSPYSYSRRKLWNILLICRFLWKLKF